MSTERKRVHLEPGFILQHRPFRDTSLLLDVLVQDHGKLTLVARGARSSRSRLKGLLRPFLPLRMSWYLRGDLGTLTGAELDGQPLALEGDALLSGFYVNELLLFLLHRHDPQPEVYATYRQTIAALGRAAVPAVVLRTFELELLRLLGYAALVDIESTSHERVSAGTWYEYRLDEGPVPVKRQDGDMVFSGELLLGIGARRFDVPEILQAANRLLRTLVAHHLGGRELKSRKVLVDLHRARARMTGPAGAGETLGDTA